MEKDDDVRALDAEWGGVVRWGALLGCSGVTKRAGCGGKLGALVASRVVRARVQRSQRSPLGCHPRNCRRFLRLKPHPYQPSQGLG